MLQRADYRLDVAADAAKLADRLCAGSAVAWRGLQMAQGFPGPLQRRGDLFRIAADPRPPHLVQAGERGEPAMDRLGDRKQAAGVVGEGQGREAPGLPAAHVALA